MAEVRISALRSSSIQPGDTDLGTRMGLVGNFAAQLFRLAGAEVMATDLSELRRQRALACGIDNVVNPDQQDLREAVMEWTGGNTTSDLK